MHQALELGEDLEGLDGLGRGGPVGVGRRQMVGDLSTGLVQVGEHGAHFDMGVYQ